MASSMKYKVGDTVRIIAGKDKSKEGKIIGLDRSKRRVLVEGINMITKHAKPSASNQQGGIVHQEAMIDVSNVMYIHKGKPTRLGIKVEKEEKNGRMKNVRVRVAKTTGEDIE